MICLVTGSTGFIGSLVVSELAARGHTVHGLFDTEGKEIDLVDAEAVHRALALARPTVVFHLGGVSGPSLLKDRPGIVARVNGEGTVNLLEACVTAGVERVIFASSEAGYMFDGNGHPGAVPGSVYGATKRFGELLMAQYARTHSLRTTNVRIGSVFGPGRVTPNPIHRMVRTAVREGKAEFEPNFPQPCISATDCARLMAALAEAQTLRSSYDAVAYTPTREDIADILVGLLSVEKVPVPNVSDPPTYPGGFDIEPLLTDVGSPAPEPLQAAIAALITIADTEKSRIVDGTGS